VRYLILSDIHANIDALEAVLGAADGSWERTLVLGDLVGYGAEPNAVIDRVRSMDVAAAIRGNHDKASCGIDDASNFNQLARYAALWTGQMLTPENREFLRNLSAGPICFDDVVQICHGAPYDEDHYIFDSADARLALDAVERPLCLFGHTHLPVIFFGDDKAFDLVVPDGDEDTTLALRPGLHYLVNPGAVGQPRDGDPRAAFAVYDSEQRTLVLRRVAYPVEVAQRRILAAGLPATLANRLAIGR
jgi:diadenosine tetraphosphatase ApaH/serine/threonine PP2A family protein phosphatase